MLNPSERKSRFCLQIWLSYELLLASSVWMLPKTCFVALAVYRPEMNTGGIVLLCIKLFLNALSTTGQTIICSAKGFGHALIKLTDVQCTIVSAILFVLGSSLYLFNDMRAPNLRQDKGDFNRNIYVLAFLNIVTHWIAPLKSGAINFLHPL